MEKKTYLKPSMQIFELQRCHLILCYSEGGGDDAGYIPNKRENMNQMA